VNRLLGYFLWKRAIDGEIRSHESVADKKLSPTFIFKNGYFGCFFATKAGTGMFFSIGNVIGIFLFSVGVQLP
jgi:hypothetical protein